MTKFGKSFFAIFAFGLIVLNIYTFNRSLYSFVTVKNRQEEDITDARRGTKVLNNANDSSAGTFSLLVPQEGYAPNLPSIRIADEEEDKKRGIYGGKGDKSHLGGFTKFDPHGVSPHTWKYLMEYFGVKTLLDVGCGKGVSTSWFYIQGLDVQCVEGSHDAIENNLLNGLITENAAAEGRNDAQVEISKRLVEHDFSRGPWWPEETKDAIWCVELLEHVGRNFQKNYLPAFKKAAFVFATHSNWGGWHHTEVHDDNWWISRFQMYGFVYSKELTDMVRKVAREESNKDIPLPVQVDGKDDVYNAQHVWSTTMVFINPVVASLPQHSHMLAEPGCYVSREQKVHCGEEPDRETNKNIVSTPIPEEFKPIPFKEEGQTKWDAVIKKAVEG